MYIPICCYSAICYYSKMDYIYLILHLFFLNNYLIN